MTTSNDNGFTEGLLIDPVFRQHAEDRAIDDAAWQAWGMNRIFDLQELQKQQEAQPDPEQLRLQELAAERQKTLDQVREQGYKDGHAKGLAEGLQQGQQEGYKEGHQQGLDDASALTASYQARLLALGEEAAKQYAGLEQTMGQGLIELGLSIARHIIGQELKQHPEHIIPLVKQAISQPPGMREAMEVRLHPGDLALIEQSGQIPPSDHIRLIADNDMVQGGWIVRTAYGEINATLQNRWAQAVASLGITPASVPPPGKPPHD